MEDINLENLNNETLIDLVSLLEGMDDTLKEELESDTNEKN